MAAEYSVRPTRQARRSGKKLLKPSELYWVIGLLRLLRHWPGLTDEKFQNDLDFEKITTNGAEYYELRIEDSSVLSRRNLRVFFWIDQDTRTIWIVDAYWKKTQKLETSVRLRVARKVNAARAAIQDGITP